MSGSEGRTPPDFGNPFASWEEGITSKTAVEGDKERTAAQ